QRTQVVDYQNNPLVFIATAVNVVTIINTLRLSYNPTGKRKCIPHAHYMLTMEDKFGNILHDWRNYMVGWTRDRAPKLIVILVIAFILVRILNVITRRIIALSDKRSPESVARAQQVRTVASVLRSCGVFLIIFLTGMSVLKDAFNINIEPLLASAGI